MRPEPVAGFVLRTLLWLPLCFGAWYWSARYHAAVVGWLARILVDAFHPGIVSAIEQPGLDLVFVTPLVAHPSPGESGLLVPEVNPLLYTYGLAFFAAIMLAARANVWKLLAGALVLLPFQAWGVAFDFLAQVGVRLGSEISTQTGLSATQREVIALGYQLGSLILPTLVPVILWAAFNRPFIERLLRARSPAPHT